MEEDNNEIVPLVLADNQRFNVNRKKLINKSHYFAALFSENFKDHSSPEHKIEFEIPQISFQDFINWINCECDDERNVMINAIQNNVERLLTLLNLSIIYQIKDELKLTETIIDILQNRNLIPEDAYNVWLLAQQLNFKMLRDLFFSVCLDRFTELPINLICELSKENFLQLIKNTNLRIPKTIKNAKAYLSDIAQEWMKVNKKDTIPLDNLEKTGPKIYQSIIYYNRQNYRDNNEFNLHCWNGDKSFELPTFRLPEELINNQIRIKEMKIIARGHNLYFIGGEFGIGSGKFNTKVWRYSLITKKWHFETTMPCERREMIAVFVQNKLLLAGGLGFDDQRLKSLDIYDVHKGTWTQGMDMPFTYMDYVGCCNVVDKYLIYFSRQDLKSIYIYNSEINYWCKVAIKYEHKLRQHNLHMSAPVIKQFKSATCHVDMDTRDRVNLKSIICDNAEYKQEFYKQYAQELEIEEKYKEESNFDMYFYFINYSYNDEIYDYYVLFCSKNENVEYKLIHLKRERLPWRSVPIQNLNAYQSIPLNICSTVFSNLMDPADLYTVTR